MMETQKSIPESTLKINKIIKTPTVICDEITDILEDLLRGCYFEDIESIIGAIIT